MNRLLALSSILGLCSTGSLSACPPAFATYYQPTYAPAVTVVEKIVPVAAYVPVVVTVPQYSVGAAPYFPPVTPYPPPQQQMAPQQGLGGMPPPTGAMPQAAPQAQPQQQAQPGANEQPTPAEIQAEIERLQQILKDAQKQQVPQPAAPQAPAPEKSSFRGGFGSSFSSVVGQAGCVKCHAANVAANYGGGFVMPTQPTALVKSKIAKKLIAGTMPPPKSGIKLDPRHKDQLLALVSK